MACLRAFAFVLLVAGCTSPISSESLPGTEPAPARELRYQAIPEAPQVRPPLQTLSLLATNPEHPSWALSDGRRLWIADGEGTLVEQRRDYATTLRSLKVDDAGNVWLLDERDRLQRRGVDGEIEQLPPLPVHDASLVIGAERLVLLGSLPEGVEPPPDERSGDGFLDLRSVLAISDDGGLQWQLRRRPSDYSEFDELLIAPDGTMQLLDGNEASCGGGFQERWVSHVDRPGWRRLEWPFDAAFDRHAGVSGWSYALDEGAFTAVGRDGVTHVLQAIDERSRYAFVHDGRKGMLLSNEGLSSVVGSRAKRIGDVPPALHDTWVHAMAITYDGAVIVSAGESIYVGSAAGWSTVELGAQSTDRLDSTR